MTDSPFSKELPNLQIAWDSTSLGAFFSCPAHYNYMMHHKRQAKKSAALLFGIHIHSALELYEREIYKGVSRAEARRKAWLYAYEKGAELDEMGDTSRTKFTLVRAVLWYFEHYKNLPLHTLKMDGGVPAIELSFRIPLGITAVTGEEYVYCGHLDRMVEFDGDVYVLDYKTTKSITGNTYKQWNPNLQITGYIMAADQLYRKKKCKGAIIDIIKTLVGSTEFARHITMRTRPQIDEWRRMLAYKFREAEMYAQHGEYPMNPKSCFFCVFKEVCASDPAVRPEILATYEKGFWNPLENR